MRRFTTLLIGITLISAGPLARSAGAGGSPLDMERDVYAPGETARGSGDFWRGCCDRGVPADGPFPVYLVAFSDAGLERPPLPPNAVPAGEMRLELTGETQGTAFVEFVVPDVSPGRYYVTHCNDPCTKMLGDLTDAVVQVVGDPGDALVDSARVAAAREVDRRFAQQNLGHRLERLRARVDRLESDLAAQGRRSDAFESALRRLKTEESHPIEGALVPAGIVLAIVGGFAAAAPRKKRNRPI